MSQIQRTGSSNDGSHSKPNTFSTTLTLLPNTLILSALHKGSWGCLVFKVIQYQPEH